VKELAVTECGVSVIDQTPLSKDNVIFDRIFVSPLCDVALNLLRPWLELTKLMKTLRHNRELRKSGCDVRCDESLCSRLIVQEAFELI
jgi:hypothetical protein